MRAWKVLVVSGPFRRWVLVVSGPTVGGFRTFLEIPLGDFGYTSPQSRWSFSSYKAYYKAICISKEGSGLLPACLNENR